MKTRHFVRSFLASALTIFVTNFASAASLTLPSELEVQGSEVKLVQQQKVLSLDSGKQLVEVVYRDLFADNADDSGAWITSAPLYLTLDVKDDDAYRLVLPKIITQQDAETFIRMPKAHLVSEDGLQQQLTLMNHQQLMEKLWLEK